MKKPEQAPHLRLVSPEEKVDADARENDRKLKIFQSIAKGREETRKTLVDHLREIEMTDEARDRVAYQAYEVADSWTGKMLELAGIDIMDWIKYQGDNLAHEVEWSVQGIKPYEDD